MVLMEFYISFAEKFKAKANTNILDFQTYIFFVVYLSQNFAYI